MDRKKDTVFLRAVKENLSNQNNTRVSDKDDPLLEVHAKCGENQSRDQYSLGSVGLVITCDKGNFFFDKGNFLQHINVLFYFAFLNMWTSSYFMGASIWREI